MEGIAFRTGAGGTHGPRGHQTPTVNYRILYVDSPTFEGREEFAKRLGTTFKLPVDSVSSIEEFAAHLRQRKYALIVTSDSMLFQDKVVQGWSTLVKFLAKTRPDDLTRFVLVSNRAAIIEEAALAQVQAFPKGRDFDKFTDYARAVIETVTSP